MLTLVIADSNLKVTPQEIDSKYSRPDLVQFSLMLASDSRLAEEREVKTIVHTRDNKIFQFEPDVNIPTDQSEFQQMLVRSAQGTAPKGIEYREQPLMAALKDELGHKMVMSPKGVKKDLIETFSRAEDYVVVIGGFLEGDFVSPVYEWTDKTISISDRLMKSWSVTAEVLVGYRYCSLE